MSAVRVSKVKWQISTWSNQKTGKRGSIVYKNKNAQILEFYNAEKAS